MSLFVKVKDMIVRKDSIKSVRIESFACENEDQSFLLFMHVGDQHVISKQFPTLKQARFALNKIHRDLEGETESW